MRALNPPKDNPPLPNIPSRTVHTLPPGAVATAAGPGPSTPPPPPPSPHVTPVAPPPASSDQAAEDTAIAGVKSDIASGQQFIGHDFDPGALGRVDASRSADMADAIARNKALSDGLTPAEKQAREEQANHSIGNQTQANMQQLASIQGAQGLGGGTAAAQQGMALQNALLSRQDYNRQLLLDDATQKRLGTAQYTGALAGAEGFERAGQEYNLGQQGKEAFGRTSIPLQYAGLLGDVRSGARSAGIAKQGLSQSEAAAARADWLARQKLALDEEAARNAPGASADAANAAANG